MGKFNYLLQNIATAIYTIFNRRDKKTIIVGAWMGSKFADNSRYLYQYLYKNKKELGLNNVIWVTRNRDVNVMLNNSGYKSCLIGTKESKYWHLKAGCHVLCNMAFPYPNYDTDLDVKYSFGAKKLQLWHGIGMKAVGAASNKSLQHSKKSFIKEFYHRANLDALFSLGGWTNEYFLSTSKLNGNVNLRISSCREDRLLYSIYPRNCECLELLDREVEIINKISEYTSSIIYLPTFRSSYQDYTHPLSDSRMVEFLKKNNVVWIEKPHSASDFDLSEYECNANTIFLESEFDINVLYSYVDGVISDYSSAVFDAVYKHIPVIMYTPDLEIFKNGDVGFLFNIDEYCKELIATDFSHLMQMLEDIQCKKYFSSARECRFDVIRKDYFDNKDSNYEVFWSDVKERMNL